MPAYFACSRASIKKQGVPSLGLEAQQAVLVSFRQGARPQGERIEAGRS